MSTKTTKKPAKKKPAKKVDFAAKKAEATEAVEKMHQRLAEGVISEADWLAHVSFMSRMHNYSPRNLNLMWAQWQERKEVRMFCRAIEAGIFGAPRSPKLPELTYPAAFSTWQKMVPEGQQVLPKGEKALSVLAPFTVTDWKAEPNPVTGKHPTKVIGFVLKNATFDISQTIGIEAPPSPVSLLTGDGPEGVWDALVELAEADGWSVSVESIPRPGVNGYCAHLIKQIVVSGERERAQQIKTLAHEIAHKLLHDPETAPKGMSGGIMEIEAESVAYAVLNLIGFDSSAYSLGYVHGWANGDGTLIASTLERVAMTTTRIMTFLETGELPAAKSTTKFDFTDGDAELAV